MCGDELASSVYATRQMNEGSYLCHFLDYVLLTSLLVFYLKFFAEVFCSYNV